ncbi:hypothetical protein [Aliiglaciecola lipolytica]|uniref:Porin domain-containing protein n=1 Tax=Aliiglaciecola lipolytica E3 TaxID=1127673 RepID=K6Y944_9ALTE|nr:hypothetical protein [Aliiglaciecola lipolytica]GAC13188.1 hypothetical protein GLIP_0542 [Aliiglaciecola lipolytica E3]
MARHDVSQCAIITHVLLSVIIGWSVTITAAANEIGGMAQIYLIDSDDLQSYQNQGTGILRHDENGVGIQQALLYANIDLTSDLTLDAVANYYPDGEQHLGFSQLALNYKPLSPDKIKFKGRVGFFYPRLSLENVDKGWLSPYTYTQSAINSWVGEEMRTLGLELSLYSPGRARRSPWSWEVTGGLFQGNDPLGTLISWRGFAMHDRQSLNNDRVQFAPYSTVIDPDFIWHPNYVEPFHELDQRWGFYLGAHLNYFNQSALRYYYYDNQADPLSVNRQRLYGWRTKFHSLSAQHKFTSQTRLISQWMSGSTVMGLSYVFVDFDAWYLMLSHTIAEHRISLRYDRFIVSEDDIFPTDPNSSDGYGLTLAWRYDITDKWQIGVEQHMNKNTAQNRVLLNLPIDANQHQTLLVTQFRW